MQPGAVKVEIAVPGFKRMQYDSGFAGVEAGAYGNYDGCGECQETVTVTGRGGCVDSRQVEDMTKRTGRRS